LSVFRALRLVQYIILPSNGSIGCRTIIIVQYFFTPGRRFTTSDGLSADLSPSPLCAACVGGRSPRRDIAYASVLRASSPVTLFNHLIKVHEAATFLPRGRAWQLHKVMACNGVQLRKAT